MFSLVAPIDDEIVSDVERSFAALDDLRNDVLVLLRGGRDAEHHAFVPVEVLVEREGCDTARVFRELDLVEAPPKRSIFEKTVLPFSCSRTSSIDRRDRMSFTDDRLVCSAHVDA